MTPTAKRHWFWSTLRAALVPLVKSERELAFEAELQGRTLMDDETFYRSNYANTCIPREIPLRLREVVVRHLGPEFERIQPADKPTDGCAELDLADLIDDVAEEFGVSIPLNEMKELDRSFDSLVKCVAAKCRQRPPSRS